MTKFSIIPKRCKVLHIHYSRMCYNGYCHKSIERKKVWHIGRYYVAEHSKTPGLNKVDAFIITEFYAD